MKFSGDFTATNLVVDHTDGTYSGPFAGLVTPNAAGKVRGALGAATAAPLNTGDHAVSVAARTPARLEMIVTGRDLYEGQALTSVWFQVSDFRDRPAGSATKVQLSLKTAIDGTFIDVVTPKTCTTDVLGRCSVTYTHADGFAEAGTIFVTGSLPDHPSVPIRSSCLTVNKAPAAMAVDEADGQGGDDGFNPAGFELPIAPLWDPTSAARKVNARLFINPGNGQLGGFEVKLTFDNTRLSLDKVVSALTANFPGVKVPNTTVDGTKTTILLQALAQTPVPAKPGQGKIHVATVVFNATAGFAVGDKATFTGKVQAITGTVGLPLTGNTVVRFRSAGGVSEEGSVTAIANPVRGILVRSTSSQLFALGDIDGTAHESTPLNVLGVLADGTTKPLGADAKTKVDLSAVSGKLVSFASGNLTAKNDLKGGWATVKVTYPPFRGKASIQVLAPGQYTASLSDSTLKKLGNYPTEKWQTSRLTVLAHWYSGGLKLFAQDITSRVAVKTPPEVAYAGRILSSTTASPSYDVTIYGSTGDGSQGPKLASAKLTVDSGSVDLTNLHVIAPCLVEPFNLVPDKPRPDDGLTALRVGVYSYMDTFDQTCDLFVYGIGADGTRIELTGDPNIELTSDKPGVAGVVDGKLKAIGGSGTAIATATLTGTSVTGTATVNVKLPEIDKIEVTPASSKLAVVNNPAGASLRALPTQQQLKVTVFYKNGTKLDFTDKPFTTYVSSDPAKVSCNAKGLCSAKATSAAAGDPAIEVTVAMEALYPGKSAKASFTLVSASSLSAGLYEPTPAGSSVKDETLNKIEGTTTYQDAVYRAWMHFTDGEQVEISANAKLTVTPSAADVLTVDKATRFVVVADTTDQTIQLVFGYEDAALAPGPTKPVPDASVDVTISKTPVHVDSVVITMPGGADLKGVKGDAAADKTLEVVAAFSPDGAHRKLFGDRAIAGLLAFSAAAADDIVEKAYKANKLPIHSSEVSATIDAATGKVSIVRNGRAVLTVGVAAGVDITPKFGGGTLPITCDLLPAVGDLDLGAVGATGVPFPDVAPGTEFVMRGRVNTGASKLGFFTMYLTVEPAGALTVIGGSAGITSATNFGATSTFSANPGTSEDPTIKISGAPDPNDYTATGMHDLFNITFKANKPDDGIIIVRGKIFELKDKASAKIGDVQPRDFVSGAAIFDPTCKTAKAGDANGDGCFDGGDIIHILAVSAGNVDIKDDAAKQKLADVWPNGHACIPDCALFPVSIDDAAFASDVGVGNSHFAAFDVKTPNGDDPLWATNPGIAAIFDITLTTSAMDAAASLANVQVQFTSTVALDGLQFVDAAGTTSAGTPVAGEGKVADAEHIGGGVYRLKAKVSAPTTTDVVYLVTTQTTPAKTDVLKTWPFFGSKLTKTPFVKYDTYTLTPATTCKTAADCPAGTWCNGGSCMPTFKDGVACTAGAACTSGYCANGFCCAGPTGDCCGAASDCPASYSDDKACNNAPICSGQIEQATCTSSVCAGELVADPGPCDGKEKSDCGAYPPVKCDAAGSAPECATGCTGDADCDAAAFCKAGACVPDLGNGEVCGGDDQCASGNCDHGFCCGAGAVCCTETVNAHCKNETLLPPVETCTDAAWCAGARKSYQCNTTSFACEASVVQPYPKACDGKETTVDCGDYKSVTRTCGSAAGAPSCGTSCTTDADCTATAKCLDSGKGDGSKACLGIVCTPAAVADTTCCPAGGCGEFECATCTLHVVRGAKVAGAVGDAAADALDAVSLDLTLSFDATLATGTHAATCNNFGSCADQAGKDQCAAIPTAGCVGDTCCVPEQIGLYDKTKAIETGQGGHSVKTCGNQAGVNTCVPGKDRLVFTKLSGTAELTGAFVKDAAMTGNSALLTVLFKVKKGASAPVTLDPTALFTAIEKSNLSQVLGLRIRHGGAGTAHWIETGLPACPAGGCKADEYCDDTVGPGSMPPTFGCLPKPGEGGLCTKLGKGQCKGELICAGYHCAEAGACTADTDCDDKNACTVQTCQDNLCVVSQKLTEAKECDSKACTVGDACNDGVCVAGTALPAECIDNKECTTDGCTDLTATTFTCSNTNVADATACNKDGNGCTVDQCQSGACTKVKDACDQPVCNTVACSDDGPLAFTCGAPVPIADATPCSDGDGCTSGDVCAAGVCAGAPKCAVQTCKTVSCDANTFECIYTSDADATPCNKDDNGCTVDRCQSGTCTKLKDACDQPVCNTVACSDDGPLAFTCGAAVPVADATPCSDSNGCTTGDVCSAGVCAGAPKCAVQTCKTVSCDANTFECTYTPQDNTTLCNDDNPCSDGDKCDGAGACKGTGYLEACEIIDGSECNPAPGFCQIDAACVAEGTANPVNSCEKCLSATNQTAWSPVPGCVPTLVLCEVAPNPAGELRCPLNLAALNIDTAKATAAQFGLEFPAGAVTGYSFECLLGGFNLCGAPFNKTLLGHGITPAYNAAEGLLGVVLSDDVNAAITAAYLEGGVVQGDPKIFDVVLTASQAAKDSGAKVKISIGQLQLFVGNKSVGYSFQDANKLLVSKGAN